MAPNNKLDQLPYPPLLDCNMSQTKDSRSTASTQPSSWLSKKLALPKGQLPTSRLLRTPSHMLPRPAIRLKTAYHAKKGSEGATSPVMEMRGKAMERPPMTRRSLGTL